MVATEPEYEAFLKAKVKLAPVTGFEIRDDEISRALKPHNRLMVKWMVEGGRRACFAAFGLHKTVTQLEVVRITLTRTGGRGLIICPLGVRQEFVRDAIHILKWPEAPKFIRKIEEAGENGIYLTNYETVRDGKLDPRLFQVASLDEASVLRGFGGTKTFREFMRLFTGDGGPLGDRRGTECVPFRFVATATPSPNDYIELLAYADFLGVMDTSQAKTRFFKRDSTQADKLTLHGHKEEEFWLWVASWALFVQKPSDLTGNVADDEGYIMPPVEVIWHELRSDHSKAGHDRNGQTLMFRDVAIGITGASKEKRDSLDQRIAKMMELREEDPYAHRIIWHDTEIERAAIKDAIPEAVTVQGKDTDKHKEDSILGFSDGLFQELAGKPCMLGSGTNFQRHCHWEIFLGIGFKFNDFIQSIHRVLRFGQEKTVRIDIIYTEAEREVRRTLERKWKQHEHQVNIMVEINKKYGLSMAAMAQVLSRKMGVDRVEVVGENYTAVLEDNVKETRRMKSDSVGLIVTSWPFSTQYEYSPNYADFGHSDNNEEFFAQMDYLTPEEYRILQPGRLYALHVKDRIVPGGMNGLGFQTTYPFHMHCVQHMVKHGFAYIGMKSIITDVVRENNQTYRLGWTEQCKDGSRMGFGMPEYLLLFRKPQTDSSKGYADVRIKKDKKYWIREDGTYEDEDENGNIVIRTVRGMGAKQWVNPKGYSRARWQFDAHGFTRSAGDRLMDHEELRGLEHHQIFKLFKKYSLEETFNFEHVVKIAESLEMHGMLPSGFMLLQPQSWQEDVWTDITRMRTLNGKQWSLGKEMHICLACGSNVLTKEGYKPIETLKEGDLVLTHKGRWRPVTTVICTGVQEVVNISAQGVSGLILTPTHKVWTRRVRDIAWAKSHSKLEASRVEPDWLEAKDISGSYINQQLPPVEYCENNDKSFWWLVGRWLADGHMDAHHGAVISVGKNKLGEFLKMAGDYGINNPADKGSCVQILLKDKNQSLRNILRQCGEGAANKQLPPVAYTLPEDQASALLMGYLAGDGYFLKARNRWSASSVSKPLLLGISMLAQRVFGAVASLHAGRGAGTTKIEGRTVNTKQEWVLSFDIPSPKRYKGNQFILEDGAWKKVRNVESIEQPTETWCLKVEEDESFTAEGCIVHNCPLQFDIVDRAILQWSNEGDIVHDSFAGLFTVPRQAILHGRKGSGIELSGQYFWDGVGHLKAAEMNKDMPSLFDVTEEDSFEVTEVAA